MENKNPYIKQLGNRLKITKTGRDYLDQIVTDSTGQVYAFYGRASPLMVAAAMARLSRRGSDLRETFLDEFAMTGDTDASGLIHRVVTAYGDDSVQQLAGMHIVVESASNILTKLLEWGRFGAYLEQSTRYIFLDEKDKDGNYRYFVPENLNSKIKTKYKKTNDIIFSLYSEMVRELTEYVRKKNPPPDNEKEQIAWRGATKAQACDAVRPVLPVSAKLTVGIFGSAQAIESLILHLLAEPLLEAQTTGQKILEEARKVMPAFLERADKPDRGGATTAYRATTRDTIKARSNKTLPKISKNKKTSIKLLDYWPKNELDIIPQLLFATSNLSTDEISAQIKKLSTRQKKEIFKEYVGVRLNRRHRPGRALEIPHYLWEVTADYGTFRDLQRHRVIDALEWQKLSTTYGYDIPNLIKEAGLQKKYQRCFELAERLHEHMQDAGYQEEAQYTTLLGHKMRYRFMLNARAAFHFLELRTSPQGHPGYRYICNEMYRQLRRVHPSIGRAMKFVNKDEDPELTRMAAELATQYKLEKLDKLSASRGPSRASRGQSLQNLQKDK
ncbi:FAD-dependent thymidylate synthase [Candidatus Saccharibacteria bacterium]|nr:FAD-dependent thymidylate synthase [Candidatus Saccharibacteria bacterium]